MVVDRVSHILTYPNDTISALPLISRSRINRSLLALVFLLLFSESTEARADDMPWPQNQALLLISTEGGRDVIKQVSSSRVDQLFRTHTPSELVLSASYSDHGAVLIILTDEGNRNRSIYRLKTESAASIPDVPIFTSPGIAWPFADERGSIYFVAPELSTATGRRVNGIHRLTDGRIEDLALSQGKFRFHRPTLAPDGSIWVVRKQFPVAPGTQSPISTCLLKLDPETQETAEHLVDQDWTLEAMHGAQLLLSSPDEDEQGSRSYFLYDPHLKTVDKIYQTNALQVSFSADLRFVAMASQDSHGGSNFDIFLHDIKEGSVRNITSTPTYSESLIGWIPAAN